LQAEGRLAALVAGKPPKIWGFLGVTVMRVLFGWMMVKDLRRAAGHVGAGGGGGGGWGYMLGCPEIR
jgi:hypothetical protein